jgi:hypothetical protein
MVTWYYYECPNCPEKFESHWDEEVCPECDKRHVQPVRSVEMVPKPTVALVFADQNGKSVELFDDEKRAKARFYETRERAGGDALDFEWEDGYWFADSNTESCHVTREIKTPEQESDEQA